MRPDALVNVFEPFDFRVLKYLDSQRQARALQTPDQPRGINQRGAIGVVETGFVTRRIHPRTDRLTVQDLDVIT